MFKTLTRHGNSLALVIERPILDILGAEPDTPFEITTDGQVLILSPVRDPERRKSFTAALAKVNKRHPRGLKKLAE